MNGVGHCPGLSLTAASRVERVCFFPVTRSVLIGEASFVIPYVHDRRGMEEWHTWRKKRKTRELVLRLLICNNHHDHDRIQRSGVYFTEGPGVHNWHSQRLTDAFLHSVLLARPAARWLTTDLSSARTRTRCRLVRVSLFTFFFTPASWSAPEN